MALKTLLFITLFVVCAGGALFMPLLGVLGYVAHYSIGPERQWWAGEIRDWGIRYSYVLALFTAIGIALHYQRLQFGKPFIRRHEGIALLFIGMVWLSVLIGEESELYTTVDHPAVKMTKVVLFCLMMTHIVTTEKRLNVLLWTLTGCSLLLGLQAYQTPYSQFTSGRLESVGGADFAEANFLPAYLAGMLPLIGVQFLRSRWLGKAICVLAGAFATNAIILTRSRGAVVGLAAGGLAALMLAPKGRRLIVGACVVVAGVGAYSLMDPGFVGRAGTITTQTSAMDGSATSRIEIWEGSLRILSDHPFGVGAGNFFQVVGRYLPMHANRDAHNTYVRCYTELGIQGFAVFLVLVVHAGLTLRRVMKDAERLGTPEGNRLRYAAYGLIVGLVAILACGLTVTLIYTEVLWWLLLMPVCLQRAVVNLKAEAESRKKQEPVLTTATTS